MNEKVKGILLGFAERACWSDLGVGDFNPMESSGGNFDDAYSGGIDAGETLLARRILDISEIPYLKPKKGE